LQGQAAVDLIHAGPRRRPSCEQDLAVLTCDGHNGLLKRNVASIVRRSLAKPGKKQRNDFARCGGQAWRHRLA
jgi:hypothetical protein